MPIMVCSGQDLRLMGSMVAQGLMRLLSGVGFRVKGFRVVYVLTRCFAVLYIYIYIHTYIGCLMALSPKRYCMVIAEVNLPCFT